MKEQSNSMPTKKSKKRILYSILIALAVLVLLIIIALPMAVSSQKVKNIILTKANESLKGKLDFSKLSMSWFSGIKVNDITYQETNNPQVVRIEHVTTKPHYTSFLFGSPSFGQTTMVLDGNEANPAVTAKSNGWTLKGTADMDVQINELVLEKLQPLINIADPNIHVAGTVNGNITGKIKEGQIENLNADIKAGKIDVTLPAKKEQPAQKIKADFLNAQAKMHRENDTMNVEMLDIKSDLGNANLGGIVPMTSKAMEDFLKPTSPYALKGKFDFDLQRILTQTSGIIPVKGDIKITSGKISGDIDTVKNNGQKNIVANATLAELQGSVSGKQAVLSQPLKVQADITSDKNNQIIFNKADVTSSFCNVSCSGSMEQLKYQVSADLGVMQKELGQFVDTAGYQIQGKVEKQGDVSIKKDSISVTSKGSITGLNVTSPKGITATEPKADFNFAGMLDKAKNIFTASQFNFNAGLGQLNVSDIVVPMDEKSKANLGLKLSMKNVDLNKVQQFVNLTGALPKDMRLGGMLQGDIAVDSKKTNYHVVTNNTKIKDLIVVSGQQAPFMQPEISFIFDGYIDPSTKVIDIKNYQLDSKDIKIKVTFEQKLSNNQVKMQGNVNADYDWQALNAMARPFMPAGLQMFGHKNATVNFASQYPVNQPEKLMQNLNTKAELGFDSAQYMGLNLGATTINVNVENGMLTLTPFTTPVNGGQLNFGGNANFAQMPSVFRINQPTQVIQDVRIDDVIAKSLLAYLNPIFANAANVKGIANLNCQTLVVPINPADVRNLEVKGTVSVTQLQLNSALIETLLSFVGISGTQNMSINPTEFTVKDGFIRYDNMIVNIGNNQVIFRGVAGLADNSLNMEITAKGQTLPLTGTLSHPKLDVGKLIQKGIQQNLLKGLDQFLK